MRRSRSGPRRPPAAARWPRSGQAEDLPHPVSMHRRSRHHRSATSASIAVPLVLAQARFWPGQRDQRLLGLAAQIPFGRQGAYTAPSSPSSDRLDRTGSSVLARASGRTCERGCAVLGRGLRRKPAGGVRRRPSWAREPADARAGPPALRDLVAAGIADEVAACTAVGNWRASRPACTLTRPTRGCDDPDRHLLQVVAAVPRSRGTLFVGHQRPRRLCWAAGLADFPLARVHATRPRRTGALRHRAVARPQRAARAGRGRRRRRSRGHRGWPYGHRHCARYGLRGGRRRARRGAAPPPRHPGRARRRPRPDGGLARRSQGATGGQFADPRPMSVGESRSRVAMARCGVARPVPQWTVVAPGGGGLGAADSDGPTAALPGNSTASSSTAGCTPVRCLPT